MSNQNSVNTNFTVGTDQLLLQPSQPVFLAKVTSQINNVTGDGTEYKIAYDTETFDIGADFSSDTFTAPLTGFYRFCNAVAMGGITTHTDSLITLVTSNRTYIRSLLTPTLLKNAANELGLSGEFLADMDAADTADTRLTVSGATLVIDIITNGSTDPYTWFSGGLVQ